MEEPRAFPHPLRFRSGMAPARAPYTVEQLCQTHFIRGPQVQIFSDSRAAKLRMENIPQCLCKIRFYICIVKQMLIARRVGHRVCVCICCHFFILNTNNVTGSGMHQTGICFRLREFIHLSCLFLILCLRSLLPVAVIVAQFIYPTLNVE